MGQNFPNLYVQGEISQFVRAASGHVYITLKDDRAVLKAVLWRSTSRHIQFELEEGLEVICRGGIDVYPPRGSYQIIIQEIHPCGMGALQLAFRQLVERLRAEGLFDEKHKKPLPPFPEKIGIITSETGAAVRDMIRVIKRRWPVAGIYLLPAPVQGKEAARRIADAVSLLNAKKADLDVIIVSRGGGSLEDLWAFNEECVARAIFESRIPVVSAVGHEIDVSVSDFAADLRAATPSEAGENTVPDRNELLAGTQQLARRLGQALQNNLKAGWQRLNMFAKRHALRHPESIIHEKTQHLDEMLESLQNATGLIIDKQEQNIKSAKGQLEALNPLNVLCRGYSITFSPAGKPLTDPGDVRIGDEIDTFLKKGRLRSIVQETNDCHQPAQSATNDNN